MSNDRRPTGAGGGERQSGEAADEDQLAYEDLEALDIDRDFNVWESFRSSLVSTCTDMCAGSGAADYVADESKDRAYPDMYADGNNSLTDDDADAAAKASPARAMGRGAVAAAGGGGKPQNRTAQSASDLTKDERDFIRKWSTRVRKEEVYSRYYRPVPRELREMQELATFLGVPKEGSSGGNESKNIGSKLRKTINLNLKQKGDEVGSTADDSKPRPAASTLFYPLDDEPKSILLKREPVLLRDAKYPTTEGERELILVTRGFVVASTVSLQQQQEGQGQAKAKTVEEDAVPPPPTLNSTPSRGRASPSMRTALVKLGSPRNLTALPGQLGNLPAQLQRKVIRRNFESCDLLSEVEVVEDVALTTGSPVGAAAGPPRVGRPSNLSFAVTVSGDNGGSGGEHQPGQRKRLVFSSGKDEQKVAWIEALEIAVIQARILTGSAGVQPGWEHEILRTSLYSAAVLNNETMMKKALSTPRFKSRINELDSHGFAALHYATMRNHLRAMEMLLKAGANANAMNMDQRVPMYFAERSKFEKAADLLETYGGTKSTVLDEAGELFGQAAQAVKMSMYGGPAAATAPYPEGGARGEHVRAGGGYAGTRSGGARKYHTAKAAKDTETKTKGAAGAMSDAMNALRERGERLQTLDEKTADLQNDASEYRDLAKQLKEKAKKENKMFGF